MKQTKKRIGSLLIAVCMVLTMLPTVAFAEEGSQNSGTPLSTSKTKQLATNLRVKGIPTIAAGQPLPTSIEGITVSNCTVTGLSWTEAVNDNFLGNSKNRLEEYYNYTFIPGRTYMIKIAITANEGYNLNTQSLSGEISTVYSVNDELVDSNKSKIAWDSLTTKKYTVCYLYTALPEDEENKISELTFTCQEPTIGQALCEKNAIAVTHCDISNTLWRKNNINISTLMCDGAGKYELQIICLPKEGKYFAKNLTATINNNKITVIDNSPYKGYYNTDFKYTFTVTEENVDAIVPTITAHPADANYTVGDTATVLTTGANIGDGGTLSYQWYSNAINFNNGGAEISGERTAIYTPPTDTARTTYYYCVVTNTNNSATGNTTATATSNTAKIIVTINADTYAVTVNSGTASPSTAAEGADITIIADSAPSVKRFKEWTIVSGGISLADPLTATTSFTMPANAVEVTATYEDISAGVTPVTGVTLNKTALSLYSNTSTKTANLTATITPADATDKFVTWQSLNPSVATVDESGQVTAVGNGMATITVTTTDVGYTASCIVTVSTYTSGGSSSSGGGSGGGSSSGGTPTKATTVTEKQPNQPITAVASVTATAGTNGTASASISDKAVTDAIAKAQAELKKQSKTANGIAVGLNVTMPKGATTLTATLAQNGLNSLVSAGVTNLEINGAPIILTFDQKVLTEIQKQSSGNVNIAIAPQAELSKMAKALIGTRPVYNITVGYGNNMTLSSFGGGVATVGIPYTPANGEAIGGLYAVYVDQNGNASRVAGSAYDANSGCIIFTTTHFSMYGVGYSAPSAEFADISSHWAKESIDYVVGRGLLSGTSETTFAPNTAMTRGMLVTALGRLEGVDISSYTKNSFTDVKAGSTFNPYIEWAYEKGIIQGIGNNKFAPDRAITREEIAVIVANFTKATGYTLPVKSEATTYADDSSISSTYKTAVTAMQQAGIMMGGTSNKFNPKSNATRAEVSSMLYRYMKLNME